MASKPFRFSRARVERVIGLARIGLAASALFAVWIDPDEPARFGHLTYTLYSVYLAYAVVLAAVMWGKEAGRRLALATHVADIGIAAGFQYLTLGPSSPFFIYFVFATFAAALRWGWRATVRTAALVLVTFVLIAFSLSRTLAADEFEWSNFVIRGVYLLVGAAVLVYLGQHEERLRDEMRQLARWPVFSNQHLGGVVAQVLEYAAGILGAGPVTLVWSKDDEPRVLMASWPESSGIEQVPPDAFDPLVAAALFDTTFIADRPFAADGTAHVSRDGAMTVWRGQSLHPRLEPRFAGARTIGSAPFQADRVSGRVFFADLPSRNPSVLPLIEVIARQMGVSLDQLYSHERAKQMAVAEDRIRLSRDLHDGVLQSLTGLRLELHSALGAAGMPPSARLLAIERALALEQRELRRFVDGLKPSAGVSDGETLGERLNRMAHRLSVEWRAPIRMRVMPGDLVLSDSLNQAVPLMVHEAVVNALKHAHPSRVSVDVRSSDTALTISIVDDGSGFVFSGRRDHAELAATNSGPVSLIERLSSLGGTVSVDSTSSGSRVELLVPLAPSDASVAPR